MEETKAFSGTLTAVGEFFRNVRNTKKIMLVLLTCEKYFRKVYVQNNFFIIFHKQFFKKYFLQMCKNYIGKSGRVSYIFIRPDTKHKKLLSINYTYFTM